MKAACFFSFFFFYFLGTIYFCERIDVSSIASDKICWEVLKMFFLTLSSISDNTPLGYNTGKNIKGVVNNQQQWKAMASIDSNFLYSEI